MTLVEKELTGRIKGCFYDVQNEVGLGLPEESYQRGMIKALRQRGIPFQSKPELHLNYHGEELVTMIPDFTVVVQV